MRPLALLVAMIAIACSATAVADTTADEVALRKLKEMSWPKAYFQQDTQLLDRILAPEFQIVDGDGNWSTRAYQSTNVLIKRDGQWQAIASHVSGYKKIQ